MKLYDWTIKLTKKNQAFELEPMCCFKPDELLLGSNKTLSDIQINEDTVGHQGVVNVLEKFHHVYNGEMIRIHAQGMLPIEATPEHPFLVAQWSMHRPHGKQRKYQFVGSIWKQAKDLQTKTRRNERRGDYVLIPRIQGNTNVDSIDGFPLNKETAWLLGLYTAEGCKGKGEILYNISKKEASLAQKIVSYFKLLGKNATIKQSGTAQAIAIYDPSMSSKFETWCGKYAENKKIPEFLLFHQNLELLVSFIDGYRRGDSSNDQDGWECSTISKGFALMLQLAMARLFLVGSIYRRKGKWSTIEGRLVWSKPSYSVRIRTHQKYRNSMRDMGQYLAMPIHRISKVAYKGTVSNIETTDHTYLMNNMVVHNCIHLGNNNMDLAKFQERLKVIQNNPDRYSIVMGDICDAIVPTPRLGGFEKRYDPRSISSNPDFYPPINGYRWFTNQIEPLVKKGKIPFIGTGNHDETLFERDETDYVKDIVVHDLQEKGYNVQYLGWAWYIRLNLITTDGKKHVYLINGNHGRFGGSRVGGNINRLEDMLRGFEADIVLRGHTHNVVGYKTIRYSVPREGPLVLQERKVVLASVGTFLKSYERDTINYSEKFDKMPMKTGTITVRIVPDTNDVGLME